MTQRLARTQMLINISEEKKKKYCACVCVCKDVSLSVTFTATPSCFSSGTFCPLINVATAPTVGLTEQVFKCARLRG